MACNEAAVLRVLEMRWPSLQLARRGCLKAKQHRYLLITQTHTRRITALQTEVVTVLPLIHYCSLIL